MNLEQVARISGVSRSTVSRVINHDPRVSENTRTKVLEVIDQLNYRPNAVARSLAGGQTRIIGLVIPTGVSSVFSDPYFPTLIRGISTASREHDYSVMLWLAEPDFERRTINQVLRNTFVDGIIMAAMPMDEAIVESLVQSGLPFVLVGRDPIHQNSNYVDVENRIGAMEAVMHLIRNGRRRIATLTGPLNTVVGLDRKEGYMDALKARGIIYDPNLVLEADFTEEEAFQMTRKLLRFEPDAIFAASDAMALGAIRALHEAGKRIPEDVAVVGFDDMPFSAHADPPITTVRQPIHKTGSLAAEMLIDLVEHRSQNVQRMILPVELVIRQSCGALLGVSV